MNLIWYLLSWSLFLSVGFACSKAQENRRLKNRLKELETPQPVSRRFRSIQALSLIHI